MPQHHPEPIQEIDGEAASPAPEPRARAARRRPPSRRRGRWVRLAVVVLVLTGAYWVLSYSARPLAESWLSRTIGARVEVRRVGFDPIDAVVSVEGVVAYLPAGDELAGTPIVADRASLDLQWFPLLHRRVQVRELALEGAEIELDRLPGTIPGLEAIQSATAPDTLPDGWTLQVDRLAMRESVLRVRGAGDDPPLEVTVHDAEVTATRRRTSLLGAAKNLRLDASFGGGRLRAEGHYSFRDEGLAIMADVRTSDLPVSSVLEHIPLGLEHLSGRLEAEMRYVLDERRNSLSGWARLRDARLELPGADEPTFEVRNAIADVEAIDLRDRALRVRSLVLRGMTMEADASIPSVILTSLATESPETRGRGNDARAESWRWAVDHFDASDARLRLDGPTGRVEVSASMRGENLGPRSHWSPVRAQLGYGEGTAVFEGTVRTSYDEPRLEGHLTVDGLDLPRFTRGIEMPGAHLLSSGRLIADIEVLLEPSAAGVGLTGSVTLDDLAVVGHAEKEEPDDGAADGAAGARSIVEASAPAAPPDDDEGPAPASGAAADPGPAAPALPEPPDLFALGADRIDLRVSAPAPPAKRRRSPPPPRAWTVDATLSGPYLRITRYPDRWGLPPLEPEPAVDGEEAPASTDVAAAATPAPTGAETAPGEEDAAPSLSALLDVPLSIGRLRVREGRITVVDAAALPYLTFDVAGIWGEASRVGVRPFTAAEVAFEGRDRELGRLELRGNEASRWGGLEIAGDEVSLYGLGPYLERLGLPYRFAGGTASFASELRLDVDGWTADTFLVLNDPLVDTFTEDHVVPELLGMSLSSAFQLLRDRSGDVRMRVPRLDNLHQQFGIAVYDAVRQAHESPSSGGALTPTPIGFAPGQTAPTREAAAQLRSVARLVGEHSLLRIEVAAPASLQDRRWLAEMDVLHRLQNRGGLMSALSIIGVRDGYERIRVALERRARGEEWYLDDYDEDLLDQLLEEQPPVSEARLQALGRERMATIEQILRREGIGPDRVSRREMPGLDRTTLAAVLVTVHAESRPLQPPAPAPLEDAAPPRLEDDV